MTAKVFAYELAGWLVGGVLAIILVEVLTATLHLSSDAAFLCGLVLGAVGGISGLLVGGLIGIERQYPR